MEQLLRGIGRGVQRCKDGGSVLPKHLHLFSAEKHFVPVRIEMGYPRAVQALLSRKAIQVLDLPLGNAQ